MQIAVLSYKIKSLMSELNKMQNEKLMCHYCFKISKTQYALNRHINHNCKQAKIMREK